MNNAAAPCVDGGRSLSQSYSALDDFPGPKPDFITGKKHILLVSVPGYGHIIPLMAFARRLVRYCKVTFAVSTFMLDHLRQKGELSSEFESLVDVIGLDDGIEPGIPEYDGQIEAWLTRSTHRKPRYEQFLLEMPATQPVVPVKNPGQLINQVGSVVVPVDLVIGDLHLGDLLAILSRRNIPYHLFRCSGIGPFASFLNITDNTPVAPVHHMDSFISVQPESEGPQQPIAQAIEDLTMDVVANLATARGVIVNSFVDFETKAFTEVRKDPRTKHLEFYFVGPLIAEEPKNTSRKKADLEDYVARWLDKKPARSVLYLSFGSVAMPNGSRIYEAGKALLQLGKPFIFALRERQQCLLPDELRELSKVDDPCRLGLLLDWAPQKVILSHDSVGVFVSHCGWNSAIESIFNGKPMVCWPCFADQLDIALLMQEKGIGISLLQKEAKRDSEGRPEISADMVVKAIEAVTVDDFFAVTEGWQKRMVRAVGPGGSSFQQVDHFLESAFPNP